MGQILAMSGIALTAAFLATLLKKDAPTQGLLLALAAGIIILAAVLQQAPGRSDLFATFASARVGADT